MNWHILKQLNLSKTLYLNFRYLPFKYAIKLPIIASRYLRIKRAGGTVKIDKAIPGSIQLGFDQVGIFDNRRSRSIWEVSGKCHFKGRAILGNGFKLSIMDKGHCIFGDSFTISGQSTILSAEKIVFGNNCLLSWDILVMDTDFHKIIENNGVLKPHTREIIVGNKVWIGCRSTILKGAIIPNGSVIAATTVISKPLDKENTLYGKNPVQALKNDIKWAK